MTADLPLSYIGDNKIASWTGTVTGGTPPYSVRIDWNDGQQATITTSGGRQSFTHTYATLASYDPLITVADSGKHAISEQFAVGAYTLAATKSDLGTDSNAPVVAFGTLIGLYGMLLTTISISGIIWLEAKHAAHHEMAV
jgi:hypothetical protein